MITEQPIRMIIHSAWERAKPQMFSSAPGGSQSILMTMMTCLPRQVDGKMDGWMDGCRCIGDVHQISNNHDVRRHGRVITRP